MADLRNYQTRTVNSGAQAGAVIDEGLRAYMLRVYNLMALGLAITGVVAYFASQAAFAGGQLRLRHLCKPAEVGRDARPARPCLLPELPH
jgi:FtsH-binding integral membrane protein